MASEFAVLAERCDQCLYGANKIVSNERRADILLEIRQKDTHFICHKASMIGVEAACRGDWDHRQCGQLGRIMGRLNGIRFVLEAELASLPPARRRYDDDLEDDDCAGDEDDG